MIEPGKATVHGLEISHNEFGDVFCISDAGVRGELWIALSTFREIAKRVEAVAAEYEDSLMHWNLWSEWTLATRTGPWAA